MTRFRVYAGLEHTATEEVLADVGVNSEKTKVCSFFARCPVARLSKKDKDLTYRSTAD
jgi:hypothetical protein